MSKGRLFSGRSRMLEWSHIIMNVAIFKTFTVLRRFAQKFLRVSPFAPMSGRRKGCKKGGMVIEGGSIKLAHSIVKRFTVRRDD